MSQAISPLTALLLGVAILFFGNGLQGVLLPVRATLEAFATTSIGLIASAYSAGFMIGCFCMPYVVRRVGHIRTFAVCAAIAASVVLLMALAVHPGVWFPLRALSGVCFAGLFMVIESWLNERATSVNRGQILALYMVINLSAVTFGQMILPLGEPAGFAMFAITAIAITLALVPVGLTTSSAPQPLREVRLRLSRLYAISPVGVVGGFFVGLANGAFGGLGAVFATQIGMSITGVALFMSASLVGGALAQLPIGRLSDRTDRRKVIVGVCVLAALAGGLLALLGHARQGGQLPGPGVDLALTSPLALIAVATLFGAAIYSQYSLCVAHTNDFVSREEFVEASSGLLLTWAIGASVGPILGAFAMEGLGIGGLFLYTAAAHVGFAAFTIYRITRRAAVPPAERDPYVVAAGRPSRTTPACIELDPRAPAPADEAAAEPQAQMA
jgi:MFS family permease